jgi:hypothetical protein
LMYIYMIYIYIWYIYIWCIYNYIYICMCMFLVIYVYMYIYKIPVCVGSTWNLHPRKAIRYSSNAVKLVTSHKPSCCRLWEGKHQV